MEIIDFHAHAFPDAVAVRAVPLLEKEGHVTAMTDGTAAGLVASMDRAGIHRSVVASIATKPQQFAPILAWSAEIASDRLVPFPSVHPAAADPADEVRRIAASGFRGIKMHPYYQDFDLDEDRLLPLYRAVAEEGLVLLMHTGFDIAFDRVRKADPVRALRVLDAVPDLLLVTSHWGAWEDWDEVEKHLLGQPIYMDISFALQFQPVERSRAWILAHPGEFILFGTDSPWSAQDATLDYVRALRLDASLEAAILGGNAARLLGQSRRLAD